MKSEFMGRALHLAEKAKGRTSPNPMVGAVIVKGGRIVGEGFHEKAGSDHAEIAALKAAKGSARGATLYVTLEPCCHHGKTPPCTDAIIAAGIKKVIFAGQDPNPLVSGKGMAQLKNAGITVLHGLLLKEAQKLNEAYNKFITEKIPFITVKAAVSLDGKIAAVDGTSKWISNGLSRRKVHELRMAHNAVMVGVNTVLKDDPRLNVRLPLKGVKHPLRIVVDSKLRTPSSAHLFHSHGGKIWIATSSGDAKRTAALESEGATIIRVPEKKGMVDVKELLKELGRRGIVSVMIEGGSTLFTSVFEEGVVDKICLFYAPIILGGSEHYCFTKGEGAKSIDKAIRVSGISFTPMIEDRVKRFTENLMVEGYIEK